MSNKEDGKNDQREFELLNFRFAEKSLHNDNYN
jgi:hypothetical protein